ncbi:SGNH hydrolase-type esterase domain-containing protein [Aspergillus granulosus]|uniref:SGNH hydrolase-type esterase domain-containing protein n=1 Tax=Aspergillus granulosus TaxID=176169 RepID=A0ABR4GSB6_9EURO
MRLIKLQFLSLGAWATWTGLAAGRPVKGQEDGKHWVATWTATTQEVEIHNLPPTPFGGGGADFQFENATLRQTFRVSIGAERFRVQVSNLFGQTDLPITAASLAFPEHGHAGAGGINTSTIRGLTFNGSESIIIPPEGIVYSDPIDFKILPLTNVALSIYSEEGQAKDKITGHPGSRTTSWMGKGNKVNASSIAEASTVHWYFASAIEALVPKHNSGLVILGDSITDGRGSDDNKNNRWPDALVERLYSSNLTNIAVNNQAAGGNAVLRGGLGPPLLERYHRDAIEQSGVKYVIIFEGVNDIGPSNTDEGTQQELFNNLIDAYSQIVADCRDAGLVTIGATITPFSGSEYADPSREVTRVKINDWISTSDTFDHAVDFAAFIGDGDKLKPEYDSGDHLHPNVAAYRELARRFDTNIFRAQKPRSEK